MHKTQAVRGTFSLRLASVGTSLCQPSRRFLAAGPRRFRSSQTLARLGFGDRAWVGWSQSTHVQRQQTLMDRIDYGWLGRSGEGLGTMAGCSTVEGCPIRLRPSPQQVTGNPATHGLEAPWTALAGSVGGRRSPKQVQEAGSGRRNATCITAMAYFTSATHTGLPNWRRLSEKGRSTKVHVAAGGLIGMGSIDQRRGWDGLVRGRKNMRRQADRGE
jgi:hypothetical protein